jgi:hypothetical protein
MESTLFSCTRTRNRQPAAPVAARPVPGRRRWRRHRKNSPPSVFAWVAWIRLVLMLSGANGRRPRRRGRGPTAGVAAGVGLRRRRGSGAAALRPSRSRSRRRTLRRRHRDGRNRDGAWRNGAVAGGVPEVPISGFSGGRAPRCAQEASELAASAGRCRRGAGALGVAAPASVAAPVSAAVPATWLRRHAAQQQQRRALRRRKRLLRIDILLPPLPFDER